MDKDMYPEHGHAPWIYTMDRDMHRGNGPWNWTVNMHHGHAPWTCTMDARMSECPALLVFC